jgi:hypothetical protein
MVDDVALIHFILSVWEFSNNVFSEQWIRQGGPIVGPVPSVELNLLGFYLWGHLNSVVLIQKSVTSRNFNNEYGIEFG